MKIFFYGGTFDPPHIGHQAIIEKCLGLCDKLVLVPNNESPEKNKFCVASSSHRLNMLNLLFNNKKIEIDLFELNSKNTNYTFLTIEYLKKRYENSDISMIIGYDQWMNFKKWYRYNDIIDNVNIICFNRSFKGKNLHKDQDDFNNISFVSDFAIDISSTMIKDDLLKTKTFFNEQYLNYKIMDYIKENKLYGF